MWLRCPKTRIRLPTEIGGAGSSKRLCREYGGSLRRACCQANGLAYASTLGWMRVEPQQRDAHPTKDQSGSMNPHDFSRGENQSKSCSLSMVIRVFPEKARARKRANRASEGSTARASCMRELLFRRRTFSSSVMSLGPCVYEGETDRGECSP
jgi:hypothetical protein